MKVYPVYKKKVTETIIVPIGDTGEVTTEKMTYDLPQVSIPERDAVSVVASVDTELLPATEMGILGILMEAPDVHQTPQDDLSLDLTITEEEAPTSTVADAFVAYVVADSPAPEDDSIEVEATISEISPVAEASALVATTVEAASVAWDDATMVSVVSEAGDAGAEFEDVSLALEARETHTPLFEVADYEVTVHAKAALPDDGVATVAWVTAESRTDESVGLVAFVEERSRALEDVTGSVADFAVPESSPASFDVAATTIIVAPDAVRTPVDRTVLDFDFGDHASPAASDDVSDSEVRLVDRSAHPPASDDVATTVVTTRQDQRRAFETAYVHVSGIAWADGVAQNSNFSSPANATDRDTSSYALLVANSTTGFLGLTQTAVTVNGTLRLSFPDPNLTQLNVVSAVLEYQWSTAQVGGLLAGQSVNMQIGYSLNNGGSWVTAESFNNTNSSFSRTVDLGALTWAQIQGLQFRATGSVNSGGGLLVASSQEFRLHYARLRLVLERTW